MRKATKKEKRPSITEAEGGAFEVFKKTITICATDAAADEKRLHALLRSSHQPDKYHDRDLKKLAEIGALPILSRILTAGNRCSRFTGTPFANVVDKCTREKRRTK